MQHSLADTSVQGFMPSKVQPAPISPALNSTASSTASVCKPPEHLCDALPSSSPHVTSSPADASAEDLDWQKLCLQTILPRPKSAEPVQATSAKPPSPQHNSPGSPSQRQRNPGHLLPGQPGSLGAILAQKHRSTTAEAQLHALHYAAVFLDPLSVAKLLAWAPPVHSCPTADHMTLLFRPSFAAAEQLPLGTTVELSVTAKTHNSTTQVISTPDSCMPMMTQAHCLAVQ